MSTFTGIGMTMGADASTTPTFQGASTGPRVVTNDDARSWYEAMSKAWGQALDTQATRITDLSAKVSEGGDQPSNMVELTAQSLKMQFMSNNAATAQNSVGQALETLGKRQ
ncbi:hypothetical protein [Coralloluteibacterium stylophorae]|uniref:Uncharacterized protein n=1 Tax=Coralloluteibacterium stylophorae TaxID=1776034 RepID=A0A8J7VVJ2_9GAMM|nr:hypothetical protein [Coralloluteibacterium stylophorae]MBS7458774.1 hypothetical protein [Coralloluteibacterium stylophorae]